MITDSTRIRRYRLLRQLAIRSQDLPVHSHRLRRSQLVIPHPCKFVFVRCSGRIAEAELAQGATVRGIWPRFVDLASGASEREGRFQTAIVCTIITNLHLQINRPKSQFPWYLCVLLLHAGGLVEDSSACAYWGTMRVMRCEMRATGAYSASLASRKLKVYGTCVPPGRLLGVTLNTQTMRQTCGHVAASHRDLIDTMLSGSAARCC